MAYNLWELPPGREGRVLSLTASGGRHRRLLDIGLTPGARVACLGESPGGDPRAYLIRGAVIAIRSEDARSVLLEEACAPWA